MTRFPGKWFGENELKISRKPGRAALLERTASLRLVGIENIEKVGYARGNSGDC